jgi:nitroreductase
MQNEIDPQVKAYRSSDHPVDPAFLNRWSPRAFSPEPVDEAALMSVFEAARWAASSYNEQPWRFILARNEEDRARFLDFLLPANQAWARNAPALFLVISKKTFDHNGKPNIVSQYDAGTCSGHATLQASLNGLVAHGMVGFDHDRAREALGIPEEFDLMAVYAIGKQGDKSLLPPDVQERELPSGRRPLTETLMEGRFASA